MIARRYQSNDASDVHLRCHLLLGIAAASQTVHTGELDVGPTGR